MQNYLQRNTHTPPSLLSTAPMASDTMAIVIPCHHEPDIITTLKSLANCVTPRRAVEVMVVINDRVSDPPDIRQQNRHTLNHLNSYAYRWPLHIIDTTNLPNRAGGVGAARKCGMDAAISRMVHHKVRDGLLLSMDADCLVNPNYLSAIAAFFDLQPTAPACITSYAHRLDASDSDLARTAIINYELHLRLYVLGLQRAELPYAFPTIGSCFACRAHDYARQGGMNCRQAGEDFYFLHKLAQLGTIKPCHDALVLPSPRISKRTPFGTGQAIGQWMADGKKTWSTYHPSAFDDLATLVRAIDSLWVSNDIANDVATLPATMQRFLQQQHGVGRIHEIRANTASITTFRKRLLHWFDGFLAMKFIRFACNDFHGWLPVEQAISTMLNIPIATSDNETLLIKLRQLQSR
ncbi:MAG: glycosyltransferase [Mariprofundales bacterium]